VLTLLRFPFFAETLTIRSGETQPLGQVLLIAGSRVVHSYHHCNEGSFHPG
jgi:hypothetical protein